MSSDAITNRKGKRRLTTVLDIAVSAGVAPMTVSRVINDSGYVSKEMRERVQRAIDKLGYRPNALARSLKRRRTHVVGILVSDIANPFSAQLAGSIQQVLLEKGYTAFVSITESAQGEQAALDAFFDHRVDGVVVATVETVAGNEALARIAKQGMPIVGVGRAISQPAVDRVTADNWRGAFQAVEHLISLGHKRIGFIGASLLNAGRLTRFQGFADCLREHGLPLAKELIVGPESEFGPGYSTQADGYDGMKQLLALPHPPTAVFARNDFTAMGAISATRDSGLTIPEDIALVGFDNVPLAAYATPPLTTVAQPTTEQGQKAALMLLERIGGLTSREGREACFNCQLIIRESTLKRDR
jgi:DNA-binding LacI/PurR family transcriptional regulator